ncbi:MAG: Crp/Fnr family transcriptional regulator [Lachnospiraceae bacterium]|nr:Crp/Fnr family transcriptional regulator [Lachnospiraceae bacterium]
MESEVKKLSDAEIIKKLSEAKLFAGVPIDEIEDLVRSERGHLSYYQKGEILIHEGETWNSIDVVLEGEVSVKRLFQDGSESAVHLLRENGVIGMEFLQKADQKSQYYYVAESDVTNYGIHKWFFTDYRQLGEKVSFQMLKNLISILSHENLRQHRKLDILSTRNLRERILVYLNYEQKKRKQMAFDIPFSREALAAFLCVNRSALSRELSRMEEDGLLKTKGKHFQLLQ